MIRFPRFVRFPRWVATGTTIDAWEDRIAEAVATELNDPTRLWAPTFAAEGCVAQRTRKPWYTAVQVQTLQVAVVPLTITRVRESRSERKFDYGIGIDFQKEVDPTDEAQLESLSRMAEEVQDWFDADAHSLINLPMTTCLKSDRPDVYSLAKLQSENIWETLITMDVRLWR